MAASEPSIRPEVAQAPRGACLFWFWSIPLCWLTSALIVLGVAPSAVFFLWFVLACTYLFRSRSRVVWLVALALPMHGYAAIAMDLRGPAHYHGAAAESAPRHAHGAAERHFHVHAEAGVTVDDGERGHESNAAGNGKNGSAGGFDTQTPAPLRLPLPRLTSDIPAGEISAANLPVPGRLERPPASAAIPRIR